jgi:hypothetical protein
MSESWLALYTVYSFRDMAAEHPLRLDILPSVYPHDCPSACALAAARIKPARAEAGGDHIGRISGATGQTYTQGVICTGVSR